MPSPEDLEMEEWDDNPHDDPDDRWNEPDDEDGCTDARCVCGADE